MPQATRGSWIGRARSEFGRLQPGTFAFAQWVLAAVFGLFALAALIHAIELMALDWEWFVGESLNPLFAERVADGGPLYTNWRNVEPAFAIYPPGYYLALALLQGLMGDAMWPGRLLSFASTLFTVFALARVARRLGLSRPLAITSACGLFTLTSLVWGMYSARPDALALALGAATLWAVTAWEQDHRRLLLIVAVCSSAGMIVTKHNLAPLLVALAGAVWIQDRRSGTTFLVGAVALSAAVFVGANVWSDGAFWANSADFSGAGYSVRALFNVANSQMRPLMAPVLAIGVVEAVLAFRNWREVRASHLAWVGGMGVVLTAIKLGSAPNYWLVAGMVSALLVGIALRRVAETLGLRAAITATLFLALVFLPGGLNAIRDAAEEGQAMSVMRPAYEEAAGRIAAADGTVLVTRADFARSADQAVLFDPHPLVLLAKEGKWDPRGLAQEIARKRFALIQSSFDLAAPTPDYQTFEVWPRAVVAAARESYCHTWHFSGDTEFEHRDVWLYVPCSEGLADPASTEVG